MTHSSNAPAGAAPSNGEAPPSAGQWAKLLRHLPAPVYLCDADGYITDCNQAAIDLWGRAPTLGQDRWQGCLRLFQTDGQPLPLEQSPTAHALRSGQAIHDAEVVIERPDGTRRIVRINPSPIFDASGKLWGVVNQMMDATLFKEADHARARLAAIVESSEDAIISKDLNGVIQTWNRGAEKLFGYMAEEAIGQPTTLIIPEDRLSEEPDVLARIRRGEVIHQFETIRRRKDGTLIHISLTISPIRDRNGLVTGASKFARDIGDRVRYEQQLRDADRKKDEFIATMAHELRNPLAPLKTSLHLIRMTGYSGQVRSTLEMMERQVEHLGRLVEDLLDLSRLSYGTIELRRQSLPVGDIVSDAIEIASPKIQAKDHRLELKMIPNLRVHGDLTRLVQVLANLLNNACKFTPKPGLIQLVVERAGDSVRIRVIDDGIGIAPENQKVVFGMFERLATGATAESGMGIGLSLAQRLVALHSGTIELRSEGLGKGTEFTVTLPLELETRSAAPAKVHAAETETSRQRRILIVDDNEDAADSLAILFQFLGHEIAVAHRGDTALSTADQFRPDVVMLDIGLPDLSGNEVAARMRKTEWGQSATLVALTGWGQADDRQKTRAAGFDFHMVKPVDLDALEQLVGGSKPTRH